MATEIGDGMPEESARELTACVSINLLSKYYIQGKYNSKLLVLSPRKFKCESSCLITPNIRWKQLSSINWIFLMCHRHPIMLTSSLYGPMGRSSPMR